MNKKSLILIIGLLITIIQMMMWESLYAQPYDTVMQKYLLVKTWKGTININYSGINGEFKVNNTSRSNVILTNEVGGMVMMWPYPDVTKRNRTDYSISEVNGYLTDCQINVTSSGQMDYGALIGINVINKTYYLHCIWNDEVMAHFQGCIDVNEDGLTYFHPDMVDIEEYPIDLSSVTPVLKGNKTYTDDDGLTVTADWNLIPETGNSLITLDPIDENWLPEHNSVVTTKFRWDADDTPTQVRITLYDISREPGICLNSIERDKSPDLEFDSAWVTENHYEITRKSETEFVAERTGLEFSNELTIALKCLDYGASGKLKAEILINEEWKTAVVADGYENSIIIPYDKDGDKIADKWEADNEAGSLSPDSDEDKSPSTGETGDAVTLYEEYRGFFVLDPDKKHIRTNPNERELFVIDIDELFSVPSWKTASDVMAYRLDNTMVKRGSDGRESRIVDFNQEYAAAKHKYSIRLKKSDEIRTYDDKTVFGEVFPMESLSKPPKYCDSTVIYISAITNKVDAVVRNLILLEHQSDDTLSHYSGLTREEYNRIKDLVKNASAVTAIKEFFIYKTIIHEAGHSCGVIHHAPVTSGNALCPMKYEDAFDSYILIQAILTDILNFVNTNVNGEVIISFGDFKFCNTPFSCYTQIKTKDD